MFEQKPNAVQAAEQPPPSRDPNRAKRALDDNGCVLVGEHSAAGAVTTAAARPNGRRGSNNGTAGSDAQRVLRASDLENSIASISATLRWRSPAKPHKLARIHRHTSPPGPATAIRGIVDVGAEVDDEDIGQPGKPSEEYLGGLPDYHQLEPRGRRDPDGGDRAAPDGRHVPGRNGDRSGQPLPMAPPLSATHAWQQQPDHQQQQEWGCMFRALSLGGGRGSQRSDPVWAAVSSNRTAGGSAARRCDAPAGPDPQLRGPRAEPAQTAGRASGPAAATAVPPPPSRLGAGGGAAITACGSSLALLPVVACLGGSAQAGAEADRMKLVGPTMLGPAAADDMVDGDVLPHTVVVGPGGAGVEGRPGLGFGAKPETSHGMLVAAAAHLSRPGCPLGPPGPAETVMAAAAAGYHEARLPVEGPLLSGTMDISPVKAAPGCSSLSLGPEAGGGGDADGGLVRARPARGGFLAQEASRLLAGACGAGRMSA